MAEHVSFTCPFCGMTCGWNAKKQEYDAVLIEEDNDCLVYGHQRCAEAQSSAREGAA